MKVKYDPEADILIFFMKDEPPVDSIEEAGGVIISYGQGGEPVTIEFLNASQHNLVNPDELSITLQTKSLAVA
ncbi:MAG: DUF2283 domain-containing protein [bacterium]